MTRKQVLQQNLGILELCLNFYILNLLDIIKNKTIGSDNVKFLWSTIMVGSMEASLSFYQDIVGLPVVKRFNAGPDKEIAFLGEGETQIELVYDKGYKGSSGPEGISLGFEVRSLDEMVKLVSEKGFEIISGPFQPNPSIKFFSIKDPNGVSIQFAENI